MTTALWIVQGLLTLLFLFAGGTKLVMPIDELTKQTSLPGPFLRFIGVAEVLGALGLILPGLTGIRSGLTPLAAAGLIIIMIGATVLTLATAGVAMALIPLVVGLLLVWVEVVSISGRLVRRSGRASIQECSKSRRETRRCDS